MTFVFILLRSQSLYLFHVVFLFFLKFLDFGLKNLFLVLAFFSCFLQSEELGSELVSTYFHIVVEALFLDRQPLKGLVPCSKELILLKQNVMITLQELHHLVLLDAVDFLLVTGERQLSIFTTPVSKFGLEDVELMPHIRVFLFNLPLVQ